MDMQLVKDLFNKSAMFVKHVGMILISFQKTGRQALFFPKTERTPSCLFR